MSRKDQRVDMKKIVGIVLAVMAALTFLSRALDSVTVARVVAGYPKQGVVAYSLTGEGTFAADRLDYVSLLEGMFVDQIYKEPGQEVKAGDVILSLQMERLFEERDNLAVQLQKAELALEEEKLSSQPVPRITEETLALQQLEAEARAVELGRQDLEEAQVRHSKKMDELKTEYTRKKGRSKEEAKEEARQAMKSARRSHEAAQTARDFAVKKAEREVADKEKKLARLEEAEDTSEDDLERARLDLERAEEDLDNVKSEQDILVEEARERLYAAEEDFEDGDYDSETARENLRKEYEAALEAEDEKLKAAQRTLQGLEESQYQASQKLENARISDAGVLTEQQLRKEASALRQKSGELDIQEIRRKQARIEAYIEAQGQVAAPGDGFMAELELKAGDLIGAGTQIKLARGSLRFRAQMDKEEAQLLKQGDKMLVKPAGEQQSQEALVQSVGQLSEEGKADVAAVMPEGKGSLGGTASYTVYMESGAYNCVIPIEALREDNSGFYCLVAEAGKTILGEEMRAVRVNLEVLEKSSISAAVSGPITSETKLIVSSSKAVGEGDRVRLVEP